VIATTAANIMRQRIDEFARPMTLEMGKRIDEARGEVKVSVDIIEYYAAYTELFLAPEQLTPQTGEAYIESSPIGVLFSVQPWNCPPPLFVIGSDGKPALEPASYTGLWKRNPGP
jgi:succinate-semialdehyde dehydrogenase / glutarate-semialdehyde dehydrogenase